MNLWRLFLYIIAMAVTTYLVRMIPLTVFQKKITNRFFSIVSFLCAICCFGSHGHTGSVFSYKEFWIIRHRFCGSGDSLIQRNEHRHGSLFKLCGSFGSGDGISDIIRKRRRL